MTSKQMSDTKDAERPWQADIDRLEQTLREVLAAFSNLTGVELARETHESSAPGASPPLDHKSLKDRIRNDLETFAATTVSELAQQTERQTRVALSAIRSEASGQVEQALSELRQKLQGQIELGQFAIEMNQQLRDRVAELVESRTEEFSRWVWLMCKGTGASIPRQLEKLLEPYAEEATGRLLESFRHRFNQMLAEQVQMAQERIEGSSGFLEVGLSELDRAAKKVSTQNVGTIAGEILDVQKPLPKDERLEARVTSEQKRLIEHAAEIRGTSMTDLIVAAVLDAATRVIKEHDILVLNDAASREFAHALLNPPAPRANAKEAWHRYRKHVTAK